MSLTITPLQLDWMAHGVALIEARLKHPTGLTPNEVAALKAELKQRQLVLQAIHQRRRIPPELHIVAAWMAAKAKVDMWRQQGQISQDVFFQWCEYLRRKRLEEQRKWQSKQQKTA